MFAAVIAFGAVASFAQNPCEDADGIAALDKKFRDNFASTKTIAEWKIADEAGKQYLEKYGSCEPLKEFVDYLKGFLPKLEKRIKDKEHADEVAKIADRFLAGMKAKNWDDVYSAGKQLLAEDPEKYRDVEIVLGSIGLDETLKSPRVTKWNDDTLRYARQSLADLEGGKTFKATPGIFVKDGANFQYKDKNDAIAWMNYTIGIILSADKNNKKEGSVYLYKASQAATDTKSQPPVYQWIGAYYYDDAKTLIKEVDALAKEVKAMEADVKPADTPEVKQQKIDAIKAKADAFKAKEGILNGTVERALDAYSRAYTLAPATADAKAYKDSILKTITDLYSVRFAKPDGLDAWVKTTVTKPFPNPSTPIAPVIDPEPAATADEPAKTTNTTTTTGPAKATTAPAAKPVIKPATTSKPGAVSQIVKPSSTSVAAVNKSALKKKGVK
jgi:hypothetical protein